MNWSRAIRATGVKSFQLKGTPVARGVVKRLESVMMMVWASPFLPLTSRKPSAPAPPDLFTGIKGRGESLCFSAIPEISRAIWSAPPPVPAGMTNSMGFAGSQAFAVSKEEKPIAVRNNRKTKNALHSCPPFAVSVPAMSFIICGMHKAMG